MGVNSTNSSAGKTPFSEADFDHALDVGLKAFFLTSQAVGRQMAEKYDLSEVTAKVRSAGVKGFKAHKLLDAKGFAKRTPSN